MEGDTLAMSIEVSNTSAKTVDEFSLGLMDEFSACSERRPS